MPAFSVQVVLIKVTSGHSRITTKVDLKKITPGCKRYKVIFYRNGGDCFKRVMMFTSIDLDSR